MVDLHHFRSCCRKPRLCVHVGLPSSCRLCRIVALGFNPLQDFIRPACRIGFRACDARRLGARRIFFSIPLFPKVVHRLDSSGGRLHMPLGKFLGVRSIATQRFQTLPNLQSDLRPSLHLDAVSPHGPPRAQYIHTISRAVRIQPARATLEQQKTQDTKRILGS